MTAVIAFVAGAAALTALVLGASMTLLQLSIGATNDVADAPRDAVGQPWKPIPAGLVGRRTAVAVATATAVAGLGLAVVVRPPLGVVAVAVLVVGLAYDLVLKGTPWSWSAFAVGIPILPVFAWYGAAGRVPAVFVVVVPVAVVAGSALAIANSLVDLEGDDRASVRSAATVLGRPRAVGLVRALLAAVGLIAGMAALGLGLGVAAVAFVLVVGIAVVASTRWLDSAERVRRERAWELEAALIGALGAGWIGLAAAAGRLG